MKSYDSKTIQRKILKTERQINSMQEKIKMLKKLEKENSVKKTKLVESEQQKNS